MQTCSLACIKKHKAWAECSGERDATVYIPPSKLRTPAGVDHDYNFLHGIEMSLDRKEKVLVGDKSLVQAEELRPATTQEVRWKTGRDGKKRKVLVTKVLKEPKGRVFERFLSQKLKKYNIGMLCAPTGMSRQKENLTTLNRRTGRINWQVEWLSVSNSDKGSIVRNLAKCMDDMPIYLAYRAMRDTDTRLQHRPAFKTPKPDGAKSDTYYSSRWYSSPGCMQDPYTGTWTVHDGRGLDMWPEEKRKQFQFYLGRPQNQSGLPTTLTQLDPDDCLRDILANTRVLEFPTIYVLPAGDAIPTGFAVGEKALMPEQGTKRKDGSESKGEFRARKKQKHGNGRGGEGESDASGDEGISKGAVGLETGEVIDEQSLGEDESGDSDQDSETSSSGSDSEDSE